MKYTAYSYEFEPGVNMTDIAETLLLAVTAVEGLHGRAKVNLDAAFELDEEARSCWIDASNDVGQDIARVFVGLLSCEIGERAYKIDRRGKEPCT